MHWLLLQGEAEIGVTRLISLTGGHILVIS